MKHIMTPVFDFVGFQESSDDTHVQKLHRIGIIYFSCLFGVERCVSRSKSLFSDWMRDPDNFK